MSNAAEQLDESGGQEKPTLVGGQDVESLLKKYKDELTNNPDIFDADKESMIKWLNTTTTSEHTPDAIDSYIKLIPEIEKKSKEETAKYGKKMEDLNKKGAEHGLILVSERSQQEYLAWLKKQPLKVRQKVHEQPFYKEAERLKMLENFKRLPEAERHARVKEINAKKGIEEKGPFVEALLKQHTALKTRFLALPKEVQEQNREKFKAMTLKDREEFFKKMTKKNGFQVIEGGQKEGAENADQRLCAQFELKMAQKVKENLFSPLSMEAYGLWFAALPTAQKQRALLKSDLDNPEREAVRDEFAKLVEDPKIKLRYQLPFRNGDLDKRKEILTEIRGAAEGNKRKYPKEILEHHLMQELKNPELKLQRELYTIVKDATTWRRRAEIRHHTKDTEKIAEHAEKEGQEVDEGHVIYMNDLIHHAEARKEMKDFWKGKKEEGQYAQATNLRLENNQHRDLTGEEAKEQLVNHQESELDAKWFARVQARLPGADIIDIRKASQKIDKTIDLRQIAA